MENILPMAAIEAVGRQIRRTGFGSAEDHVGAKLPGQYVGALPAFDQVGQVAADQGVAKGRAQQILDP